MDNKNTISRKATTGELIDKTITEALGVANASEEEVRMLVLGIRGKLERSFYMKSPDFRAVSVRPNLFHPAHIIVRAISKIQIGRKPFRINEEQSRGIGNRVKKVLNDLLGKCASETFIANTVENLAEQVGEAAFVELTRPPRRGAKATKKTFRIFYSDPEVDGNGALDPENIEPLDEDDIEPVPSADVSLDQEIS